MSELGRVERLKTALGNRGIVRHLLGAERETTRQRRKAFEHFFNKDGEVEFYGSHQYLTNNNRSAVIRPDNPSRLAAKLLDDLASILNDRGRDARHPIILNGIAAMGKTARLSSDADEALILSDVQPNSQINHNLAALSFNSMWQGDDTPREPGQLDEWFIGYTQLTTAVGAHVPILLQPHEVVLTTRTQVF